MRSRALAASIGVVAILLTAGCSGSQSVKSGPQAGDNNFVAGDGTTTYVKPADRSKPVLSVKGTTLSGQPFHLSSYKGKVLVLNFWASWCAPCRGESAALEQLSKDTQSQGVQFVGFDIKDLQSAAQAFVNNEGVSYPIVYDQDASVALNFRGISPNAIPSTLVLDRSGRQAARIVGATSYNQLKQLVAKVTAEKA